MQYHIGLLPIGTVAWMMQQSIEKYCKVILNKSDPVKYSELNLKSSYSHNLLSLWNEIKKNTIQFSYEKTYDDLVNEVNNITINARYLNCLMGINLGLIEAFTVIGCEFRFELLGKNEFHDRFFGLQNDLINPRVFLNGYNFNDLFKKLMHLSIDHGISFSLSGIIDTYEHTNIQLSKATSKFCQCKKHSEIENVCPICNNLLWTDGKRSSNDLVILQKYFGIMNQ